MQLAAGLPGEDDILLQASASLNDAHAENNSASDFLSSEGAGDPVPTTVGKNNGRKKLAGPGKQKKKTWKAKQQPATFRQLPATNGAPNTNFSPDEAREVNRMIQERIKQV